jgi:GNAT superfamily N-acetyltransferase
MGLGAELIRATEDRLRADGLALVTLAVCDEHAGARSFWERMGYEASARVDRGVTLMEKRL